MNLFFLHQPIKFKKILVSIIISLFIPLAAAKPAPEATINNKPIAIDADNQQIDLQKNTLTFIGNVVINQEGLKVKADKVVITDMQSKDNQVITAYGKPVYFEKRDQTNSKQAITGHANQLIYKVKQNQVTLLDNAELFQQDNHITGNKIIYDVDQQKILAESSKGGRVKTTIVPNQIKEINN